MRAEKYPTTIHTPEFLLCAYRAYGIRDQLLELDFNDTEQKEKARQIYDSIIHHFNEHLIEEEHEKCIDAMLCLIEMRKLYGKEFSDSLSMQEIKDAFEYFANQELSVGLIRVYVMCKPINRTPEYQEKLCNLYASGLSNMCTLDMLSSPTTKLTLIRRALCMKDMPREGRKILTRSALEQLDAEDRLKGIYV